MKDLWKLLKFAFTQSKYKFEIGNIVQYQDKRYEVLEVSRFWLVIGDPLNWDDMKIVDVWSVR